MYNLYVYVNIQKRFDIYIIQKHVVYFTHEQSWIGAHDNITHNKIGNILYLYIVILLYSYWV